MRLGAIVVLPFLLALAGCGSKTGSATPAFAIDLPPGPEAPILPETRAVVVTVTSAGLIGIGDSPPSSWPRDGRALATALGPLVGGISHEERAILLRADANVTMEAVNTLNDAASAAAIRMLFLEVAPAFDGHRRAFVAHAPPICRITGMIDFDVDESGGLVSKTQVDGVPEEARVLMSWGSRTGQLVRLFGQDPIPPGPEGDARLESLLHQLGDEWRRRAVPRPPVILDCGSRVRWRDVIDVANIAWRAGWPVVQLPRGAFIDESRPSAPESR